MVKIVMDDLFEKLRNADEQEFIKSLKFGLMVLDEDGNILHFCGYVDKPTKVDRENLRNELKTDESFGLTKRDDLLIIDVPQESPNFYIQKLGDSNDD